MNEWLPIETAPRDGSIILIHPGTWTGMTASPARWDDNRFAKKPRPYWNRLDTNSVWISRDREPTHWQPLPAPPTASPAQTEESPH